MEGEGSGRAGKSGVAIAWSSPHQLSPGPDKQDPSREHCWFLLCSLADGGEKVEARVGPMLEMGPWLAIGADEMTLSCFLDRSGLPGLEGQSLVVACRLFARRRVSGWSRLAGHIGAAFVRWDMPCRCRHTVNQHFCYSRAVV